MSVHSQNGRPRNEHLNQETIEKYQARKLAVEERRAADRHLRGCGSCRRVLLARMGPVRLPEELADLPEVLHLSYEQMTAYIDDALTAADKEGVDAHLFLCASCSREVAELKKLDAQLSASAVVRVAAPEPKIPLGRRIAQFFAVPGRAREFGVAFGVIVVGFLLFQAGNGSKGQSSITSIIRSGTESNAGLHLGGYVLIAAGILYGVYSLLRKR
jgi:hypothetical protein